MEIGLVGELLGTRVIIRRIDKKPEGLYQGNVTELGLELDLIEAGYLLSRNKLSIVERKENEVRALSLKEFIRKATNLNPNYLSKLKVYEDLRVRGYYLYSGLHLGGDFCLYTTPARKGFPKYVKGFGGRSVNQTFGSCSMDKRYSNITYISSPSTCDEG